MLKLGRSEIIVHYLCCSCPDYFARSSAAHDDVIKWKHFPRNWPFVRGIHRSPVNSPHKGQWRGALMFSLIFAWIKDWVNNREAGHLRRHRGHYDVNVMSSHGIDHASAAMHAIDGLGRSDHCLPQVKISTTSALSVFGNNRKCKYHDDAIKWWHFSRHWPLVQVIHRWLSLIKSQWRGALMFSLICARTNGWKKTIEPPRIWDVIAPIMTYGNGTCICVIHQNGSAQQGLTLLHIRDQSRYMPANERCRYIVTTSLIGWVHTYTDPCTWINELLAWLTSWLRIISSACFVKRWVEYWPNALFSGSKLCQRSSPQLSWKNITWAS